MRRSALSAVLGAVLLAGPLPSAVAVAGAVHCVGTVSLAIACDQTHTTIQEAVDAAASGDAVVIGAGIYSEAVRVETPDLLIRGESRHGVIVDGTGQPSSTDGFLISVGGVSVENLTVRNFPRNGIFWRGRAANDYAARYVTAYNNGLYGIYTFEGQRGVFEDSYGSGHTDSAFYIGGCYPCDAVIQRVTAERNGLGYSGTNAGGNLIIRDSYWNENAGGIGPNSLDSEPNPPQHGLIVENNLITNSGTVPVPVTDATGAAVGLGIVSAGGEGNIFRNNTIENSTRYGVLITPFPGLSGHLYQAGNNRVENNTISGSGIADLAQVAGAGAHNCYSGNVAPGGGDVTSEPLMMQTLLACPVELNPMTSVPFFGSPVALAEAVAVFLQAAATGTVRCSDVPSGCVEPDPNALHNEEMPDPSSGL